MTMPYTELMTTTHRVLVVESSAFGRVSFPSFVPSEERSSSFAILGERFLAAGVASSFEVVAVLAGEARGPEEYGSEEAPLLLQLLEAVECRSR